MYLRPRSKTFRRKRKLAKLLRLAQTGKYSASKLAEIFGCNRKTVLLVLKDNGIRLPNLGQFRKTIYCNDNFFDRLMPISSYWLGFIAADGCLTSKDKGISIGLSLKDKSHLRKFKRAIQANSKIYCRSSNNSVKISIYSEKIFNQLVNLGILPNKSLKIKNVLVPEKSIAHFIRGVFDGDGWVGGRKITHLQFMIAGNKPFLKQIQKVLVKKCGVNEVRLYSLSKENGAYKLQYTGSQIFRILEFLYQNSAPETRLTRKYEKYLALREKFSRN